MWIMGPSCLVFQSMVIGNVLTPRKEPYLSLYTVNLFVRIQQIFEAHLSKSLQRFLEVWTYLWRSPEASFPTPFPPSFLHHFFSPNVPETPLLICPVRVGVKGRWTCTSNVPSRPRKQTVHWAACKAQVEKWSCPSTLCCWSLPWRTVSRCGILSRRET